MREDWISDQQKFTEKGRNSMQMRYMRLKVLSVILLAAMPLIPLLGFHLNGTTWWIQGYSNIPTTDYLLDPELAGLDEAHSDADRGLNRKRAMPRKNSQRAIRREARARMADLRVLSGKLRSFQRELENVLIMIIVISLGAVACGGYLLARSAKRSLAISSGDVELHWRHFQDILDSMNEGILVTDLVGFVTYANPRARAFLDPSSSEILGEHIATLVTGRWDIDRSSGRSRREANLCRADGDVREVVIERSNLNNGQGALRGMLFVIEDITEKNRLARELADHRDVLARSERMSALGTLGAIVAHKLSQPISSVRLFIQQVKREIGSSPVPQRVHDNLDESLAELGRIVALTKQMLKSDNGQLSALSKPCGGTSVLSAVVKVTESLHDAARRRGVVLSVCRGSSDLQVQCSALELEEILYSLITNSLHAAPQGAHARVDIDVEHAGNMAMITVSDTCDGIPPGHIDKIFDCFFTTKPEGQGTGLGLAIVRHIAERYGGRVEVSSEEGFGTCFMISLPLIQEVYGDGVTESIHC
jgi:PAS domain S-box-containing protein